MPRPTSCVRCPQSSSTTVEGATALSDCMCDPGYYQDDVQNASSEAVTCKLCGVGRVADAVWRCEVAAIFC